MPYLILFKHGYVPLSLHNTSRDKFVAAFGDPKEWTTRQLTANLPLKFDADRVVQESFWNGLTIELEPFRGTPTRWFDLVEHALRWVDRQDRRRVRRFLQALLAEQKYFDSHPPDPAVFRPSDLRIFFADIQRYLE